MATKFETLCEKAELEFRLAQAQETIRNAAGNDVADGALPEDAALFDEAGVKDVKKLTAQAKVTAQIFMNSHPEFYACTENWNHLTNLMLKRKLSPVVVRNYEIAFELLQKAGVLREPEFTEASIEKMTSEEFRQKLLTDPAFREAMERFGK